MEPRDYLSIAAIVISIASFSVTLWNIKFIRRAKATEMKTLVLTKAFDVSNKLLKLETFFKTIHAQAEKTNDLKLAKEFDLKRISDLKTTIDESYASLVSESSDKGLEIYDKYFHQYYIMEDCVNGIDAQAKKAYKLYVPKKLP